MAVLTDPDRAEIAAEIQRDLSQVREATTATKADWLAAASALDQFLSDNAAAANTAIPAGPRGRLTTAQKARILQKVIQYRYLRGV